MECLSLLYDSCDSRCDSDSDAMGEAEVQSAIGRHGDPLWCIVIVFLLTAASLRLLLHLFTSLLK